MSRKETYMQRREEFVDYLGANGCPIEEKDIKLGIYNNQYLVEQMCDLTDAICEIAKAMDGIKAELCQIRRQMPR